MSDQQHTKSVGRDVPHDSAATHVTGESVFLDDIAQQHGELLVGIIPSPYAHARINRVDLSAVRALPGVVCVITHEDLPGHNAMGPVVHDEMLIATDTAVFLGQPLAIVGATSRAALDAARKAAVLNIEELPPVFTIDDAIAKESFLGKPRQMNRGDVDAGFAEADRTIEGHFEIGGQEHFYLEAQVAIAVPGEQGQMTVHSSTQHPTEVQSMTADALGVPFNHVTVICKRMGGGFGGKETQAAQPAMMAALVARATNRTARFVYERDDDMAFTGKRHPFKSVYKAGFKNDGTLTAMDVRLYANGGCSTDLSFAVLERAMLHSDNASFIPNFRIAGYVCKTHLPSNTAFRGFGGPQGVACTENVLQRIAIELGIDAADVRRRNCYAVDERNTTHYGQIVKNNVLPELYDTLRSECNYDNRRINIAKLNDQSPTHLRGMATMAVKFGISFTRRTLNQANALLNIYTDGSVMVSTGATEMGQGVYTRIRQVAADALGLPMDRVIIAPTSTDKNNNTSPTAASAGTDLNGNAALVACNKLRERLAEVAARMLARKNEGLNAEPAHVVFQNGKVFDERAPGDAIDFQQVVCQAYENRVSLGERGFYATPGVDFNRDTGRGHPFLYYTNGIANAEVEIDRFTGELRVLRVDLIMDVGKPLSPGIDRGQVVGGFIQGMGWVTTEELVYSPRGELLSHSPTTYKIPAASDLPAEFNVRFLDNPHNAVSLHRSKAVGEPPLLLGLCVWFAVKDALAYISTEAAEALSLPATGERILMAMTRCEEEAAVSVRGEC